LRCKNAANLNNTALWTTADEEKEVKLEFELSRMSFKQGSFWMVEAAVK
jgi:hypothetical protein